jgi:formiminotetrahydrofolate cyclodeaminase
MGDEGIRQQAIAGFLSRLAARTAAPGGGTTAALHAAQAAALIAMVGRFSDGPRYDAAVVERVVPAADALIDGALALAEADAAAFGKVTQAYRLPRESAADKDARARAIADALAGAARPPADLLALSARLIRLAEDLLPTANRNLLGDLLAAAASVRAAAEISRVNIEANVPGTGDQKAPAELTGAAARAGEIIAHADRLAAEVRAMLAR